MKPAQTIRMFGRRCGVKKPDYRHRLLLRARRKRPRRGAGEEREQLAPPKLEHVPPPTIRLRKVSYRCKTARRRSSAGSNLPRNRGQVPDPDLNCSESPAIRARPLPYRRLADEGRNGAGDRPLLSTKEKARAANARAILIATG